MLTGRELGTLAHTPRSVGNPTTLADGGPRVRESRSNRHRHMLATEYSLPAFNFAHDDVVRGMSEIHRPTVVQGAIRCGEQLHNACMHGLQFFGRHPRNG